MNEILVRVRAEGKIRLRDIDKKNKESLGIGGIPVQAAVLLSSYICKVT